MPKFNRLFIAEKASAGDELAKYLAKTGGVNANKAGSYTQVGNDIVVAMSGHMLSQVPAQFYDEAYAKWDVTHLPIVPKPFQLEIKREVVNGKATRNVETRTATKVETIRKLLADCTTVVGFGDPDNEGQLLQDELLHYLGNSKPVIRLWANALDNTTLKRALDAMKPNSEYLGKYEAALSRSEADWLYGINMTRACTVYAQKAGGDSVVSIGRVQTPTLALVVNRELEIRNFVAVKYHLPFIELKTEPGFRATWSTPKNPDGTYSDERVDTEGRLVSKAHSDAIVKAARAEGEATVKSATTTPGTENAPLPFALSSLQTHCSRLFSLSAAKTLEVAQSLYMKKLTSYPRVDCDYLPVSQLSDAPRILQSVGKATVPAALTQAITGADMNLKSRAWDDSKVTAHHAIIPTHLDNPGALASLNDVETKVYFEILKRYVLQFYPAAKFDTTAVSLVCGGETFSVNGRVYTSDGWRKAFALETDEDENKSPKLPPLANGQGVPLAEAGADSKSTKAPKRFDDGTLIAAMKGVHQYVENPELKKRLKESVGIGTEATRGNIIEGLMSKGFLKLERKSLIPSDNAIAFVTSLPKSMTAPDMTALWQQLNDDVEARKSSHPQFIEKLIPWLTKLLSDAPGFFKPGQFSATKPPRAATGGDSSKFVLTSHACFGTIEKAGCGSPLKKIAGQYGSFYGCSNEACKKNFRDVDGKPVERTASGGAPPPALDKAYKCEQCKHPELGFLRRIERKDLSGHFWGCGNWKAGCKNSMSDEDGRPVTSKLKAAA